MTRPVRPFGRRRREDPLEAQLEHPAVGGAGQRVALGEVLDVPQEDGVAQVQRGDRRRTGRGPRRADARRRAGDGRRRLDDDRADRLGRRRSSARRGAWRAPGRRPTRNGSRAGSRRLDRQDRSRRSQARADDPVRVGRGRRDRRRSPCAASDDHPTVARTEDDAPPETEAVDEAVQDDPRLVGAGSATSSSWPPTSTSDWRSARRWRSSRSLSAEKADVAMREEPERRDVEDGHPIELDRDARGRRRPAARAGRPARRARRTAAASPRGRSSARSGTSASRETRDQVEEDEEADRALGAAGRRTSRRRGTAPSSSSSAAQHERSPNRADLRRSHSTDGGDREVGARAGRQGPTTRSRADFGSDGRPGDDDRGHREPEERQELTHPVAEGGEFDCAPSPSAVPSGAHQSVLVLELRAGLSAVDRGAARSFGSRSSRRDWTSRKSRTASIRTSGKPKVVATAAAAAGLTHRRRPGRRPRSKMPTRSPRSRPGSTSA